MSTIQDLTIPNPDFQVGNIIDSEEFDANNIAIRTKVNEIVSTLNPADDRATANEAEIVSIKGVGYVDETIKSNADAITNLEGVGRTTETVKGNADALDAHKASGDHDSRYYTETEIDAVVSDISGVGRTVETIKSNADTINAHVPRTDNPHNVTRAQLDVYSTSEINALAQNIGEGVLDARLTIAENDIDALEAKVGNNIETLNYRTIELTRRQILDWKKDAVAGDEAKNVGLVDFEGTALGTSLSLDRTKGYAQTVNTGTDNVDITNMNVGSFSGFKVGQEITMHGGRVVDNLADNGVDYGNYTNVIAPSTASSNGIHMVEPQDNIKLPVNGVKASTQYSIVYKITNKNAVTGEFALEGSSIIATQLILNQNIGTHVTTLTTQATITNPVLEFKIASGTISDFFDFEILAFIEGDATAYGIDKELPFGTALVEEIETLTIDTLADPNIKFTTNIQNTYADGANVYRSLADYDTVNNKIVPGKIEATGTKDLTTPVQITTNGKAQAVVELKDEMYSAVLVAGVGLKIFTSDGTEHARIDDVNITVAKGAKDSDNDKIQFICNEGSTGAYVVITDENSSGDLFANKETVISGQTEINGVSIAINGTKLGVGVNSKNVGQPTYKNIVTREFTIQSGGNSIVADYAQEQTTTDVAGGDFNGISMYYDGTILGLLATYLDTVPFYIRRDGTLTVEAYLDASWTNGRVVAASGFSNATYKEQENGVNAGVRKYATYESSGTIILAYSDTGGGTGTWSYITIGQGSNPQLSENANGDIAVVYEYDGIGSKTILDGTTTAGAFVQRIADDSEIYRLGTEIIGFTGYSVIGTPTFTKNADNLEIDLDSDELGLWGSDTQFDTTNVDKIRMVLEITAGAGSGANDVIQFLIGGAQNDNSFDVKVEVASDIGFYILDADVSALSGLKYIKGLLRSNTGSTRTMQIKIFSVPTENPKTLSKAYNYENEIILADRPNASDDVVLYGKWTGGAQLDAMQFDMRFNFPTPQAYSDVVAWIKYNEQAGFNTSSYASIVGVSEPESYSLLDKLSTDYGDTNEDTFTKKFVTANDKVNIKFNCAKANASDAIMIDHVAVAVGE